MDAATKQRLITGAADLGVALDETQVHKLAEYLSLLQTWNRKINLTAITAPREVVELHFLDSLAAVPLVREAATLVDVGAVAKKVAFLQTLKRTIAPNLEPLHLRNEGLDRTFAAAISRATWDPPVWLEHGARLVAPGGRLIAMQTADAPVLEAPAGFSTEPALEYTVGGARRRLQPFRRA